jgi:hypothetical protein
MAGHEMIRLMIEENQQIIDPVNNHLLQGLPDPPNEMESAHRVGIYSFIICVIFKLFSSDVWAMSIYK